MYLTSASLDLLPDILDHTGELIRSDMRMVVEIRPEDYSELVGQEELYLRNGEKVDADSPLALMAADTIPPAYPAPSPQGKRPFTVTC